MTDRKTPSSHDESSVTRLLRQRSAADRPSSTASNGAGTSSSVGSFSLLSGGTSPTPRPSSFQGSTPNVNNNFGGGLGVASATVTTGEQNNEVLSLLTDSQVVQTSSKVQDTIVTPKNLHYRLLFVSKKMLDTNQICGGIINSSVFAECACAKTVKECSTASHKMQKSQFVFPNVVYIAGSTSKNKLGNPKLLNPDQHAYPITEEEDIASALACIDTVNAKLENESSYELAEMEFQHFKETHVVNMKDRIFKEAHERSDKKVRKLKEQPIFEFGQDSLKQEYESIRKGFGNSGDKGGRVKHEALFGEKDFEVKHENNDDSLSLGSSLGSQLLSDVDDEIEDMAYTFGKNLSQNPGQNAANLYTHVLLLTKTVKKLDMQVKHQQKLFTTMNESKVATEQNMILLQQEMRLLKREFKDTRRHIRKSSQSSTMSGAGNPELTLTTVTKMIERETQMYTEQLKENLVSEFETLLLKEGGRIQSEQQKVLQGLPTLLHQQSLESRISVLEGILNSLGTGSSVFGVQQSSPASIAVEEVNNKLASIDFELTLMKSRLGERNLQFGSIDLPSEADTLLFVCDHLPIPSYGCFFDFVALLDSLRDTQTTISEYASQEHAAQKSKFLSTAEVSTSASFVHIAPLCFAGTKPESTGNYGTVEKGLPRIKDRAMWQDESGRFGLAKKLDREIQAKVTALEKEIDANLGNSKGAELARKYLFASQKCWEKLFVWTEKIYQEMASVDKIEPAEAWNLVLHCWMAFFEDLRDERVACSGVSIGQSELDSDERKEVVARYIWTMGKAIYVQNEYVDADFNNHPTIARVINYHMFHNKVPKQAYLNDIESIEKKLQDLFSWKGNAGRQIAKLESKNRSANAS